MSYTLTLQCSCIVYVACDPKTGLSHTRIVERRGPHCRIRRHDVGTRIYLWEILPSPHLTERLGSDVGKIGEDAVDAERAKLPELRREVAVVRRREKHRLG